MTRNDLTIEDLCNTNIGLAVCDLVQDDAMGNRTDEVTGSDTNWLASL